MRRAHAHPLVRIGVIVLALIVVFLSPAASAEFARPVMASQAVA